MLVSGEYCLHIIDNTMTALNVFCVALLCLVSVPVVSAPAGGDRIGVHVYNHYKVRPDGTPGREIYISYHGEKKLDKGRIEIRTSGGTEVVPFVSERCDSIPVLLPEGIGVESPDTVVIGLLGRGLKMYTEAVIPKMRHWTAYIYPHSHVDIGYTNTQANVEFIHTRNLDVAMELAEKTAGYPEDARFRWNPEVTWPVERYLNSADAGKRERLIRAIADGQISLDAGYVSTNTSAASDEELLELFRFSKEMEKETGRKVETMVQVDIPGMSWGVVTAAGQLGIKYCLSLFNGYDRTGHTGDMSFKPFWWTGPDGRSKVLFLQPGSYNPGALLKGKDFWPLMAGQTDRSKLLRVVKTENPRANFIDSYLAEKLPVLEADPEYIYDIFPMTWCMADNTPIDADLPDAVKSWNEEYAFPHLKICTGTEMMEAFASRYGDRIPELSGDFTEYWTDGLGSSAVHTGKSREVKERLVQAEILWSMLRPGEAAPDSLICEAWRNIILSTEHTWAYMQPDLQPISDEILGVKFGYFDTAARLTDEAMDVALAPVAGDSTDIVAVFNTNIWPQTGLVTLSPEISAGYSGIEDSVGNHVVSQRLTTGELAFVADSVPALGARTYRLVDRPGTGEGTGFVRDTAGCHVIDNGVVRVVVDHLTGDAVSIRYRGKEYVDPEAMTAVNSYRYLKGDMSSGYALRPSETEVAVKENGPVVTSLLVTSSAPGTESLVREIRLVAGSSSVEFINTVDKTATVEKEGVHFGFGFDIPGGRTMVNVPWGVMELDKDQLRAGNRNWIAAQRWVDISNGDKGVTWCPVNAAVFESGDMTANIIGGALDSPAWLYSIPESSVIYSWALNNHWHTNFPLSQSGTIPFRYVLRLYDGGFDKSASSRFGLEQFRPLVPVRVSGEYASLGAAVPGGFSAEEAEDVYLSTYRTVDGGDAALLRLISTSDSDCTVYLSWREDAVPSSVSVSGSAVMPEGSPARYPVTVPAKGHVTVLVER